MRWEVDTQGNSHSQYFLYGGDEFYEPTAKQMFQEMHQDAYFMVSPHTQWTNNRNGTIRNVMDRLRPCVISHPTKQSSWVF
jgi:hypothetical protein